jgi:hypothetical protein
LSSRTGEDRPGQATADLYIGDFEGNPLGLEFKTPWPKKEDCVRSKKRILLFKLILMERGAQAYMAFPYDPFGGWDNWFWTAPQIFDRREVKIAAEVWDMLGGDGTYNELVEMASNIGERVRERIGLFKDLIKE